MGVGKKEVTYYWCERCGYEWIPRDQSAPPPKVCPSGPCKSPYWQTPRRDGEPTAKMAAKVAAEKKAAKKRAKK